MIEICTQQLLVLQVLQRGTSILFSTPTEEKKKRKKCNSRFPLSFQHFLGKDVFCLSLVILSYKESCFSHTDFSENHRGGLHIS